MYLIGTGLFFPRFIINNINYNMISRDEDYTIYTTAWAILFLIKMLFRVFIFIFCKYKFEVHIKTKILIPKLT